MFVTVMLLAGRPDTQVQPPGRHQPGESAGAIAGHGARLAVLDARPEGSVREVLPLSTPEEPAAPDPPPSSDTPDVADLSRQVMPAEETTAEQDEQRGVAIRRLSATTAAGNVQPLIYALRNDVDVRNRILAINGLLRAALAGNPDRAIQNALIEASTSRDDVIASQARQAQAELERARSR
jgi:hypothetical protein